MGTLPKRAMMGAAILLGIATGVRAETPVFDGGRVLLPIFVGADAPGDERQAAAELARVLGRMSGLDWPVRSARGVAEAGFYVGGRLGEPMAPLRRAADLLAPRSGETGPDGFRIRTRSGSVFIEGATPEATYFGVCWLLQREGGVRWYIPGPLGEVVPFRRAWSLPDLDVTVEPAYVSRELTGLDGPDGQAWARHNGLGSRLDFTHALSRIFAPGLFDAHPEWFPLIDGRRHRPEGPGDYRWQPNLSDPAVAAYAAAAAAAAFNREPGRASFSLAIDDTIRFDQSPATRALVEPLNYFRGRPDYSPLVFGFMNRAAAALGNSEPDRYLGCLAYFWCENPPPFRVDARVLPYLTADRSQYYDPSFRAEDLDLMSRWSRSGVRAFGLWDYAYGAAYVIPREPVAAFGEAVREGWRRGARGYLAEVDPQWGFDALKCWMLTRLLWEPEIPLDTLKEDFYKGFYGKAAGPMRRFFDRCEALWMGQSGPAYWLKFYEQEDQALIFPPDSCRELRGYLDAAVRSATGDPTVAERVALTSKAFAVTEAFVRFDGERRSLAAEGAGDESRLAQAIDRMELAHASLGLALANASAGAAPAMNKIDLRSLVGNDPVPRLLWLAGSRDPRSPGRILARAGPEARAGGRWARFAAAIESNRISTAADLMQNGDFHRVARERQEPLFLFPHWGDLPAQWEVKAFPTEGGRTGLIRSAGGQGPEGVVRIEGAWDTQFTQWVAATPGRLYVATARFRGRSSPGGDAALLLAFRAPTGQTVGTNRMQTLPKGVTQSWRESVLADTAPPGAAWVGVGFGATRQVDGDWLEVEAPSLRGTEAPAER
jgi:hypothetical protein